MARPLPFQLAASQAAHLASGLVSGVGLAAIGVAEAATRLVRREPGLARLTAAITAWEGPRFAELLGETHVIGQPVTQADGDHLVKLRAYALLRLPVSLVQNVLWLSVTIAPLTILGLVSVALLGRWVNPGVGVPFLAACLALVTAPPLLRWLVRLDVALAASLLGGDREQLEARVAALAQGRRRDQNAAELERGQLERDLHDGAQQHLIALSARLGRLERSIVRGASPEATLDAVREARSDAVAIVADIRSLTRGLRPHLLEARGLEVALEAVARRLPVPIDIDVTLPTRPTPAIERALYFIGCELMTNCAKHSQASSGSLRIRSAGDRLEIVIDDNGSGGAVLSATGGLAGIADRVSTDGGTLTVSSPVGGPTIIRVELPCA